MAEQKLKKISQEELDEILKQHNLWVESKGQDGIRADLSFCDLRRLEFPTEVNLMGANLVEAKLEGAKLEGAKLMDATLMDADLRNANLRGANLMGAKLMGAYPIKAYLEGANLEGANLVNANLWGADLGRAKLMDAKLMGATLREVNLMEAMLMEAKLMGANLEGANLEGVNLEGAWGVPSNISLTTNLEEQTILQQFRINELEQELQKAQAENNQSQEQQEKIAEWEKQLELAKQQEQELQRIKDNKIKQEQEIKSILEGNINQAHEALTKSLINTDKQIKGNRRFSILLTLISVILLFVDIAFVLAIPVLIWIGEFQNLLNKVGLGAILFFTFPAVLILLIILTLLRHQKQLIAEIRHYSMLKHKIELYGGILKAAQYTASSVIQSQNSEAAKYIQETFNEIKTELLKSPNFDLNAQPHIFPEEGGNLVEMLKSITELLKISTEANKAIAESAKKATTSEK